MKNNYTNKNIGPNIALALLAWLLQPVAHAQSEADVLEAARRCQRVPELSYRLACYDRVFPPIAEPAVDLTADTGVDPTVESVESTDARASPAATEAAPATTAAPQATSPALVQIVEVETPDLRTSRFRAADGRVFVRSDSTTLPRWPAAPFDVELQTGRFGTTFLRFPESGLRIRVVVLDEPR